MFNLNVTLFSIANLVFFILVYKNGVYFKSVLLLNETSLYSLYLLI